MLNACMYPRIMYLQILQSTINKLCICICICIHEGGLTVGCQLDGFTLELVTHFSSLV